MTSEEGATIAIKIIPKASRNAIVGWEGDVLKVRIAAVPEKGKANEELIAFLAKTFRISKSSIRLLSGQTSRYKRLFFAGISREEIETLTR